MSLQILKVDLPAVLFARLESLASTTNQSLDAVLLQTIRGNLPPSLEDVPVEYRDLLRSLLTQSDEDLWAVARISVDPRRWQRHEKLLRLNSESVLDDNKRQEMEQLRAEMDLLVYRKSFAMALLKWRGYELSSLLSCRRVKRSLPVYAAPLLSATRIIVSTAAALTQ